MAPAAAPGKRRCMVSEGVWCLKVYDIISGPDRWQGSGYTCPLCHYTHISTSAPLSFIISICMCMCQDGVTRVGHAHTTCSAARCAATSTVHASPVRRSPDTVSNRGVVAACASQISSFTLFSQRAESVNVLAHPRKKGNVVHASEPPHQTDTSRIRLPATSLLHLFTCFLQTTSYVSPE